MAVTDYPGDGSDYPDWLQALMGNQANGGTPPGGLAQGYPASSGQQANMGYPAAGGQMSANVPSPMGTGVYGPQTTAPPAAPQQSGFARYLAALNPISSAQAAEAPNASAAAPPFFQFGGFHPGNIVNPDLFHDAEVTRQKLSNLNWPAPPDSNAAPSGRSPVFKNPGGDVAPTGTRFPLNLSPSAVATGQGDQPPPTPAFQPRVSVQGPLAQARGAGEAPYTGPSILPQARGVAVPPDAVSPVGTANAPRPGAGAGPGRSVSGPAAVAPAAIANAPVAAPPPSRFTWIDRPNMSANAGPRGGGGPPGMTALDLSGLFGGGQPAAAAPQTYNRPTKFLTSVSPAANASVPGPLSADAAYGLPDARGAPYPYPFGSARRSAALAAAGRRSGYQ
jgi:hypothetical protein